MSKLSIPTIIVALLVVLILLAYAFTFQVDFYDAAVKIRLGKAQETVTTPGLKWRWPWPIESIARYDIRLRTLDLPETEIKTADGKNVIFGAYAVWRIEDALQLHKRSPSIADVEEQMRSRISQVQAAMVGQRTLEDFVNLDRELLEASYDDMLAAMLDRVKDGLRRDYGVRVERIGVRRISLPQEVTQDVFKSMIQDRKTQAARYREEGKSRADAITARAEADARQIMSFAQRKAQEIRSAGYQASARILAQIDQEDREFFEYLRWLDALKASLKQRTTIFLDIDSPLFEPFVSPPLPSP
jgi:membrane protease subunit HflC